MIILPFYDLTRQVYHSNNNTSTVKTKQPVEMLLENRRVVSLQFYTGLRPLTWPDGIPSFLFTLEHSLKAYEIWLSYTPRKGALSTPPYFNAFTPTLRFNVVVTIGLYDKTIVVWLARAFLRRRTSDTLFASTSLYNNTE